MNDLPTPPRPSPAAEGWPGPFTQSHSPAHTPREHCELECVPLEIAGWTRGPLIALEEIEIAVARIFDLEREELQGRWIGHEGARVRGFVFVLGYDLFAVYTRRLARRFRLTQGGVRAAIRRARYVLATDPRQRRRLQRAVEALEIRWIAEEPPLRRPTALWRPPG